MSTERTLADLRDAVIAEMSDKYDLIYVDRGDRLTDTQVGYLLAGDMDSLWEDLSDWEGDARWEGVKYQLDDLAEGVLRRWEREDDEFDGTELRDTWYYSNEWEEAREEIEERDSGSWFKELVNGCGSVFVRIRAGESVVFTEDFMENDDPLDDVMANIDVPDTEETRALVRRVAQECCVCCEHVPFIFGSVDVSDIYELPADGKVKVTGGSLLFENVWAGAGYNDDLPEGVEVIVAREAVASDDAQFGYSWDDVCGLVPGSWPAHVEAVSA